MAERSFDTKRTVVVSNVPHGIGEDELTIHFQKEKNGGGDVDDVVQDGSEFFVTFDLPQDAASVLNHEQIISGSSIQVQSYESWLQKKALQQKESEDSKEETSVTNTIYVSGFKDTTTKDAITLFFENERRTGGGDLSLEEGYKRISPSIARLTYLSSKSAESVLAKAKETPLVLEGNALKVSTTLELTHDRSILLVKNLNPETGEELLRDFVESKKRAEVLKVVLGKDRKAIVILKDEMEFDEGSQEDAGEDMKLNGSIVSLEIAPLTKGVRIINIPPATKSDDIKFKFSNTKKGGGKVTDFMLDKNNGVANVYFEEYSVVSALVKKEHKIKDASVIVFPYYDDFQVLEEAKSKTSEFSGEYQLEPVVMDFIINSEDLGQKFDLKSMKFDNEISRFEFTKEIEDPKDALEFERNLKEYLQSFVKEELKIPRGVSGEEVTEAIERLGYDDDSVDVICEDTRVVLVGKKEHVNRQKRLIDKEMDVLVTKTTVKTQNVEIEDKNKLKFFNFIGYSEKLCIEFPEVTIHGMESSSGKITLLGAAEKAKDVQLRIYKDLSNVSETDVLKLSDRQVDFLRRTDCEIVNEVFKKDDVMLILLPKQDVAGANSLQAKIMTLRKCDEKEVKRLINVVHTKTSEKCIKTDEDTVRFLTKSDKFLEFKKEQFEKNKILVEPESTNPCNIWIVCEKSKMHNAEQELSSLIDDKKITSCIFKPMELMKIRFLREHCWEKVREKEASCKGEGVAVEPDSDLFQIKGTKAGRTEMITFLEGLAGKVDFKTFALTEPGMKKQMSIDTTDAVISEIEKTHKCIIEREKRPVDAEMAHRRSTSTPEELERLSVLSSDGNDKRRFIGLVDEGATTGASGGTMNLPYHRISFVNDKEIKMSASGQRISIVVGDLALEKVDVIVNTTNGSVDLNANPCGKALLKVAGLELMNECKKIGSLQPGEMASTAGWNLKCNRVYHVRSADWESGKGASILRKLIQTCLNQAEKDKHTSIAFPAIGTGNLKFPRAEVAKIFFEEIANFFINNPSSAIDDVRFVVYSGDSPSVDAFLNALQDIKSVVLSYPSKSRRVRAKHIHKKSKRLVGPPEAVSKSGVQPATNITPIEKSDGTLEFILGKNLTVQIVCNDIAKETTDVIMHVTNSDFSFQGGVGKAIIKSGGDNIITECKAIGKPGLFTTQFTKAGKLNSVGQIAHVIGTVQPTYSELKKCLDNFFEEVSKRNIVRVSFSAVGAGIMGFSEQESADLIFDNLIKIAGLGNPTLNLVRIVIFDRAKFTKFKDASRTYFFSSNTTSGKTTSSSPKLKFSPKVSFNAFGSRKAKSVDPVEPGTSVKIYSDDRANINKAWDELKNKMQHFIKDKTMKDDIIKKFTDRDLAKLRELEHDLDVKITVDISGGTVKIKGHILDIANVQEQIRKVLKHIAANQSKVPAYWDSVAADAKVHKVSLQRSSQEYQKVESEFRKTASQFQIVSIERIQNREIYELYDVKSRAMMQKYGGNLAGRELLLFHGTSVENIDPINVGGLNRNFAGQHATALGRGVYFARDAIYSCRDTFSPPDPATGLRYMYYAKVLVGEYTLGSKAMLVPPAKHPSKPNDLYNSVVDNVQNPGIFVLFQDYEFYTEYLIAFKQ